MFSKPTPKQRLDKAVIAIMSSPKYVALAGVLMIGNRTVCANTPTASTNGRDEKYGEAFIEGLSDAELRFLVLHECYHKLYRHLLTWRNLFDRDAQTANKACDYVINLKIVDENPDGFAKFIEGGCLDHKYRGMNALEVFRDLCEKQEEGGDTGGEPLDEHEWDDAKEMDGEEKRQLEREIDEAIRQGALTAGKMGAGGERLLEDLLQPQIDWRKELRAFITTTCQGKDYSTWRKPNRRFMSAGVYMPSAISEAVGELVVAIDTSGSIGQRELTVFLSEVVSICGVVKPEKVHIIYWDTKVAGAETYSQGGYDDIAKSTKPKGGGGTDITSVPKYIKDKLPKTQACIVLTDGHLYGGWGKWHVPVLWTLLDNPNATPDCGKRLHVKSSMFNSY